MVEPTQIASGPVITEPEAANPQIVGPGQEGLLEEFVQEQEARQQEPEKLLGKFNSTEDLAKAYQELEKKLGRGESGETPAPEPSSLQSNGYTPEQASQVYGQEAVDALGEKGIDMADLMWTADNGGDISEHYDSLAEVFNVPRQVVENYVSKAQGGEAETPGLTDADVAEIKTQFGGDEAFADLSSWAANNLPKDELASYNAVVDSGNRQAIEWALRAIDARRQAPDAVVQPKLLGGGAASPPQKFESKQQVLDAMNKRNSRGQRLYDEDEAYRKKVEVLIARSDVF